MSRFSFLGGLPLLFCCHGALCGDDDQTAVERLIEAGLHVRDEQAEILRLNAIHRPDSVDKTNASTAARVAFERSFEPAMRAVSVNPELTRAVQNYYETSIACFDTAGSWNAQQIVALCDDMKLAKRLLEQELQLLQAQSRR